MSIIVELLLDYWMAGWWIERGNIKNVIVKGRNV